jgi:hypothetical protein
MPCPAPPRPAGPATRQAKAKTSTVTLASGAYGWPFKPAEKGTYRMQATIKATATNAASASKWITFKVK